MFRFAFASDRRHEGARCKPAAASCLAAEVQLRAQREGLIRRPMKHEFEDIPVSTCRIVVIGTERKSALKPDDVGVRGQITSELVIQQPRVASELGHPLVRETCRKELPCPVERHLTGLRIKRSPFRNMHIQPATASVEDMTPKAIRRPTKHQRLCPCRGQPTCVMDPPSLPQLYPELGQTLPRDSVRNPALVMEATDIWNGCEEDPGIEMPAEWTGASRQAGPAHVSIDCRIPAHAGYQFSVGTGPDPPKLRRQRWIGSCSKTRGPIHHLNTQLCKQPVGFGIVRECEEAGVCRRLEIFQPHGISGR